MKSFCFGILPMVDLGEETFAALISGSCKCFLCNVEKTFAVNFLGGTEDDLSRCRNKVLLMIHHKVK